MKVLIVLILFFSFHSHAQHSAEFENYVKKYPNSHSARLNQEIKVRIFIEDDSLRIRQEYLKEDIYLDDAANLGAKSSLNFSSFFELDKIEASSFNFENGKYRESKITEFKEKDELDNSFYDDSKSINFIYPKLRKGSKTRIEYVENIKNPRFLSSFYFGDFSPIVNSKVEFIVDEGINIEFRKFNLEDSNIEFSEQKKRGKLIYTWKAKNIEKFKYESNMPSYSSVLPHIVPIIRSYELNGEAIELLGDVSHLYNWYSSLVKDINHQENDPDLVLLVNRLTEDKESDLEKVRAIYYWVQKNIKYIAFEYALGGFIPREANDVFNKKYGDCKDNSSILKKMLEIAGLKGNLTWIGTRSIPYTYSDVPTPAVDNHMILSFSDGDKTYFLDATGRYTPIEFPTSFIQGKEALIANNENGFEIKTVPIIDASLNSFTETTTLNLEGRNVIGNSKVEIGGYTKIDLFRTLEDLNGDKELKIFYNRRFRKGSNKFIISSFKEADKFSYDDDFKLDYKFSIDGYTKELGDELFINLNLNKILLQFKIEDERENDIEFEYKESYSFNNIITIPDGYAIKNKPEDEAFSDELLSFSIKYSVNDGEISYSHIIEVNLFNLDKEQQQKVNEIVKKAEKAYKEVLVLEKI